MKLRYVTAAAASVTLAITVAPVAHAQGTPLDCAGVVAVKGGYHLTQDTSCFLDWTASNQFLDLRGHTFTGTIVTEGTHQTIRNGTFRTGGSYLVSDFLTLSHLRVEQVVGSNVDFLIEAGSNVTVDHSTFADIQAGVALDFYFGSTARITNSTFVNNQGVALSVQSSNNIDIENDKFVGNGTGVNLWPEDHFGVNTVTIAHDTFDSNVQAGMTVHGFIEYGGLDGTRLTSNTVTASGGPGLDVELTCDVGFVCTPPNVKVTGNRLNRNGSSVAGTVSRSGMFARGYDSDDNGDPVSNSANLGGVLVTSNVAISNHDLGFDVPGVLDGGSNRASLNSNPLQCVGLSCGSAVTQSHALFASAWPANAYANVAHHTVPHH